MNTLGNKTGKTVFYLGLMGLSGAATGFFIYLALAKGAVLPVIHANVAACVMASYLVAAIVLSLVYACYAAYESRNVVNRALSKGDVANDSTISQNANQDLRAAVDDVVHARQDERVAKLAMGLLATTTGFCMAFLATSMISRVNVLPFHLGQPAMYGILGGCAVVFVLSFVVPLIANNYLFGAVKDLAGATLDGASMRADDDQPGVMTTGVLNTQQVAERSNELLAAIV